MNEILQITRQQCQIQTPTDPNSLRTVEQLAGSGQCQCASVQLQRLRGQLKGQLQLWLAERDHLAFIQFERLRGREVNSELQLWLQGHSFNHPQCDLKSVNPVRSGDQHKYHFFSASAGGVGCETSFGKIQFESGYLLHGSSLITTPVEFGVSNAC